MFTITRVSSEDQLVEQLLPSESVCDITMPHLQKRSILEEQGLLKVRTVRLRCVSVCVSMCV